MKKYLYVVLITPFLSWCLLIPTSATASSNTLKESLIQSAQKIQRESMSIAASLKDGEKSCEPADESSCDFYQKCNFAKRCQYDQEWPTRLTPEQSLAIYTRLKTDLGIDIPLILDKDRLDKLQDAALVHALQPDGCAYLASTAISYSPYAHAGTYVACAFNPRKEVYDQYTLRGILKGTYPDLSSDEITILEQRLREVYNSKAPGALLETTLFVNDVISIPGFVSAIRNAPSTVPKAFRFIQTHLSEISQVLPRVTGIFRRGSVTLNRSTLASLSQHAGESVDLIPHILYRLRTTAPTKYVSVSKKGIQVPAWRSSHALVDVPEIYNDMKGMWSVVAKEFEHFFGFPVPNQTIYFVTNSGMEKLMGKKNIGGLFLYEKGIVLNIELLLSNPATAARRIIKTLSHEYVHWATFNYGSKSVFNDRLFSMAAGSATKSEALRAFMEGYTEYTNVRILQRLGYYGGKYSYASQVEAVARFLGNGKYDHIFFESLKRQDIGYIIKKYGWTQEQFVEWVMRNVPLLVYEAASRDHRQIHKSPTGLQVVSAIQTRPAQVQNIDFYDDERVSLSTQNTYELVKNLNSIATETNQNELYLGSVTDIHSLAMAQSITTSLQLNGGTLPIGTMDTSELINTVINDLDTIEVDELPIIPNIDEKSGDIPVQPPDPNLPANVDVSDVSQELLKYAIDTTNTSTTVTPTENPQPTSAPTNASPPQGGFFQRIINWLSSFF